MTAHLTFALLLAANIAAAQAQDANPITYSTPAIPASRALDEIARLTGEKLKVDPPLDNEPLILNLHSAIAKDVLSGIARALKYRASDRRDTPSARSQNSPNRSVCSPSKPNGTQE